MTDIRSDAAPSGLRHILLATIIAGGIGYAIQLVVPVLAPQEYLTFATMWSATYLIVTCLSGIQQEITRAARYDDKGSGFRPWAWFTLAAALSAAAAVVVVFAVIGAQLFPDDTALIVAAIALAAIGYALVAAISGAIYGLKDWSAVAGMTIADSAIRGVTIGLALIAGAGAVTLAWATAVPFLLAAAAIWLWVGRRVRANLTLDVGLAALMRNAGATVLASLSTGALISGLPLLLKTFAADAGADMLASLVLVITLTRAPLVVPLVALQGYLIVSFRDRRDTVNSAILRWVGVVLAAVLALAALAALAGPPLMAWLYASFVQLTPIDFALIVVGAGFTGVLCITGPAVLVAGRHAWYTAGWTTSAIITVVVLMLPFDPHSRILVALLAGPVLGVLVHLVAMRRQHPQVGAALSE
ncbi:hypothetical protein ACI3KT_16620 [Microbacterium sp. ZW T6_19]|uniref:hypothetical protein n=1 Tax=Microbacterium sp. ZW T6_19 TaxID=3378082 RepID=UPI0038548C61